jgi:hypothetical protein
MMVLRRMKMVTRPWRKIEMAQQQQELYRKKKKEPINTVGNPPRDRVVCFVADYAQNLPIPNFASEQPGATYYYSPLSCYCFGVVDTAVDMLTAWLYSEAQAKKGGNNVASLLWAHLEHKGIIEQAKEEPFKEINLVMDNCGGQNKNRHVLRLLFFIVKRKIAKVARAIFLVRGHTKNDCDRLFNTMKKDYRKTNSRSLRRMSSPASRLPATRRWSQSWWPMMLSRTGRRCKMSTSSHQQT